MEEKTIEQLLENFKTPAYIFDTQKLKNRVKFLKESLPENVLLCYAIKANTFIVKEIEDCIDRLEVCSPGEYEICKASNIAGNKILITGVYKTPKVIKDIIENEKDVDYFTIESMEQFRLIKNIKKDKKIKIMLRLTSGNQFGINEEEIEEIIKNYDKYENIEITGIQYFSGTQKTSLKIIQREIDYVDGFVKELKEKYQFETKELEFGPGFPVYYFQNTEFDEEAYLKEFSQIISNMEYKGKIVLELGRSIAASCGYYITKVVDKKTNKGQNYAILDGGINHITYYGQTMAMKLPKCSIYPQRENTENEKWNLCGSLCTINDILVKQFPVGNLQIGDVFIFENTGAYCMTEGISLFLSRELPQVIKLKEDGSLELVRDSLPTYVLNK
mgnify:FL=1